LVEALKGFVKRTPKLFSLAGTVLSSIYTVFTELAGGVLSAIGTMLAAAYDSQNAAVRTYFDTYFFDDVTSAKSAETKLAGKKGLLGLAALAQERRDINSERYLTQDFAFENRRAFQGVINDFMQDIFNKNKGNKAFLNNIFSQADKNIRQAGKDSNSFMTETKKGFYYAMHALKEIERIKQYKSDENFQIKIYEQQYKNLGYNLNDPTTIKIIKQRASEAATKQFKFDDTEFNKHYNEPFSLGMIDEIKASDNFSKYATHIHSIKDGMFESGINSVLAQYGLKIFTGDNKIVVPHSMDELARLSGDDKSSLISVFRSIGQAHQIIATSSIVMNKGLLNRKDTNYPKEKSEAVKKALIAAKEALQAFKNKKVSIRNTSISVGE